MAISKKGKRHLQYHQQEFLRYVAADCWELCGDHSLRIMSTDKAIQLLCCIYHEPQEIAVVQSERLPTGKYPFSLNLDSMAVKPSHVKEILDWYFEPR